ncbi:MAG: hypothetical protein WCF85_05330 [Rhodospirillaceae bacterium]
MTDRTLEQIAGLAISLAVDAGNAMEAAFSSARSGDRDGSLSMAKEAAGKAMLAKKVVAPAVNNQTSAGFDLAKAAVGHAEDARLFAMAAMDVARGSARNAGNRQGGEPVKKSAESMAFLMAGASALLDIKRGGAAESTIRKIAMASERTGQAAEEAGKVGGAGNLHAEDAAAAKETMTLIARRAVAAFKDARRSPVSG